MPLGVLRLASLLIVIGVAALLAPRLGGAGVDGPARAQAAAAPRARAAKAPAATAPAVAAATPAATVPIVAILDSGVDLHHPGLRGRLWVNPGEQRGNRRDDDGDGFADDVHGADLIDGDGKPQDRNGHGTHVAGIVARNTPASVKLMAVRVLDRDMRGTEDGLARGIEYALAHGARILNVSVNTDTPTPSLAAAVRDAQAAGAVIVASAGNDGRSLRQRPSYPICFPEAAVVGVTATDAAGNLAPYSNHGACVDVRAIGDDILSLHLGGGLERRTGTSMAAAEVTARLARLTAQQRRSAPTAVDGTLLRALRG